MLHRRLGPFRRRLPGRAGLALLVAVVASGCSGTPNPARGRPPSPERRRDAFPIVHEDYAKLGYQLTWVGYPALSGRSPIIYFEPYDDCVVVQEAGSRVTVLETSTGQYRGSNQLSGRLTKFVGMTRAGNRLYVCSEADVYILDIATAGLVGRQTFEHIVATRPMLLGDRLIFGTGGGQVMSHLLSSASGGIKEWGFLVTGAIEHDPVYIGGALGAVSQGGDVVFLDASSGGLLGRNRIYDGLATNPVADEQTMYVAGLDQSLYAFNPLGGSILWRHRTGTPLREQPVLHDGRLYCSIPGAGFTALDPRTGDVVWTAPGVNGAVIGVRHGRLLVWNGTEAALLDPATGDVFDRVKLPGVRILRLDRFENGNLYAVSNSGVVAKFIARF